MAKFYMSDEEIRRDHTKAKDKNKQLEILADMKLVSQTVMRNKLISMGLIEGAPTEEKPEKVPAAQKIDEARARALIAGGVSDKDIAKEFGVGVSTFQDWRRRAGIMRYSKHKKNEEKDMKKHHERSVEDDVIEAEDERAADPAFAAGSAEREFLSRSAERALQESPVEPPAAVKPRPAGYIRMEPRAEAAGEGTGWTVNDFSMAHRCIGVIEGIAEGIVSNVAAKEKLQLAARTLCELMEKARIDTSQEV